MLLLLSASPSRADAVEDFYRGKVLNFIASTGGGQGLDLGARIVSRYVASHVPGRPGVINRNMPGAGHVLAANYLANEAPRDGTTVLVTLGAIVLHQILDGRGMRYDVNRFNWVGSLDTSNQTLYVWHTSVKSLEEARQRPVLMGGTGSGSYTVLYPTLLNHLAGTRFRVVPGYASGNEVHLAMERGEAEGRAGNHYSALKFANPDWVRDAKVRILVQIGLERDHQLPDVPLMNAFASSDEARRIMRLFDSDVAIGQTYLTAPDVPPDRLRALRQAFSDTMRDPEFLAEASKANLDVAPADGEKVQQIVRQMVASPPDLIAKAKQAMAEEGMIGAGSQTPPAR